MNPRGVLRGRSSAGVLVFLALLAGCSNQPAEALGSTSPAATSSTKLRGPAPGTLRTGAWWSLTEQSATVGPFEDPTEVHSFHLEARDRLGFFSLVTVRIRVAETGSVGGPPLARRRSAPGRRRPGAVRTPAKAAPPRRFPCVTIRPGRG